MLKTIGDFLIGILQFILLITLFFLFVIGAVYIVGLPVGIGVHMIIYTINKLL
ncbi:hypothetical protein [Microcystis phage Mel-JY01]